MSSIQSVSPPSSFSDALAARPAPASSSCKPPAARHQPDTTRNTPANKAVLDMVSLLDEAARHPEKLVDSTPAYQPIPLSRDEMSAGWNSHATPPSKP